MLHRLFIVLYALASTARSLPSKSLLMRASLNADIPVAPISAFLRRTHHSSTVLDNQVIIDGGDIAVGSPADYVNFPMDRTLILDMSQSWTNATVNIANITKQGAPLLNNQLLWPSSDNKSCLAYGGDISQAGTPNISGLPSNDDLWEFTLGGKGGSWQQFFVPKDRAIFNTSFMRSTNSLSATVANTGFSIGGYAYKYTSQQSSNLSSDVNVPGIATFNITSSVWTNDTADWNIANSFLVAVPPFGPSGLLLSSGSSGTDTGSQSINNITIYEPLNKTWHTQILTGTAPTARLWPCTVGIQGDNGTFEIFIYAGQSLLTGGGTLTDQQQAENTALDEVWVLSLPAFVWFKANYTAQHPRVKPTCHVVGNRQLLSIGGANPNDVIYGKWSSDPLSQGLGIFDLTEMTWSSSYDANAAPYKTPQIVKDWYSKNDLPAFKDSAVAGFFKAATATDSSAPASSTSSLPPSPTPLNAGQIAGAVAGSLVAFAIILAIAWFCLRRYSVWRPSRRRDPQETLFSGTEGLTTYEEKKLMNKQDGFSELYGQQVAASELHNGGQDKVGTSEMEATSRCEMAGTNLPLSEHVEG